MIKRFRAWDGEQYWYADDNLLFINGAKALELRLTTFELKDVDMFIGKLDSNNAMIYENDLLKIIMPNASKVYQVIWSDEECGFRKVPYGLPYPETKIDEAFMEIIGTIHSGV
jgi:hypothetical protein